jgi:hypothetical protein
MLAPFGPRFLLTDLHEHPPNYADVRENRRGQHLDQALLLARQHHRRIVQPALVGVNYLMTVLGHLP